MRLGLAGKLGLLAAVLVLATTTAAGSIHLRNTRATARERGLAALGAEAELRRRELLAGWERAQADLLYLANASVARAALVAADGPPPDGRSRPEALAVQLLAARPFYRQFALVRADAEGRELLRVDRGADGTPRAVRAADLRSWRDRPDFRRVSRLAPAGVWYSDVRPADGAALEQALAVPVSAPEGGTAAFAFLSYDFGALAQRLNQAPGRLGFLVNARGDYLAHPDAAQVLGAGDGERGPLEQAFDQLQDESRGPDGLTASVRRDELPLPGLAFFLCSARFPADTPAERLLQVRDAVRGRHPSVRIGRPDDVAGRLVCQAATADALRAALTDFRQTLGAPVTWDEPYRCSTFALRLLPLHAEARGRIGPAVADTAPWFGLGVAQSVEEFEHDVVANFWRNAWTTASLSLAAGGAMVLFSLYLTRPLRRMTGFAERVAAGQEADLELPRRAQDEIGTLARAFGHMVEQVRLRTRELRESEARIRTILNTAAEGIVTIDQEGRLESFNQAAERTFGYTVAEVRGEHFRKLLQRGAPADMPTLLNTAALPSTLGIESSLMSMSRVNGTTREVLARRKSGEAFPAEMAVSEIVLGDRLVYTAILRDITERKQAEAQIQQMTVGLEHRVAERTAELMQANQALEAARDLALEANRAKDAFLAVMSHELRTPLNAIIGYCDYWIDEADEHDPNEMLDDLRKMHVSGKHLLALINDILDLAKIQAGKVVLELNDFDLAPLLGELREWVEPLVRKNANMLTVEAAADLGTMHADRTRVRQVLLNLLSNAAKFTTSGSIHVEAQRQLADKREEVVFRIIDTGVGMTADDVKRLFQPFVQVGMPGARKPEGTGLGLAICRRLCAMMGGSIDVQSAPGVGTTFTVRLPARVIPELPGPRREPTPPAPATVLVVDADPAARELLERVLLNEGYRVRTASGVAAGLAMARRERPAAILLDLTMPLMDGLEFVAALRREPAGQTVPVIVVAAADLSADDRARLSGCVQRVLQKGSATPEQLLAEVRACVDSCVARPPGVSV